MSGYLWLMVYYNEDFCSKVDMVHQWMTRGRHQHLSLPSKVAAENRLRFLGHIIKRPSDRPVQIRRQHFTRNYRRYVLELIKILDFPGVSSDFPALGFHGMYEPLTYTDFTPDAAVLPTSMTDPIMSASISPPTPVIAPAPLLSPPPFSASPAVVTSTIARTPLFPFLLPFSDFPQYYQPRTVIQNIVQAYSKESGHLSDTSESFESPMMSVVSAPSMPMAAASALSVTTAPKFPTLLGASVQRRLFAKKTAARLAAEKKEK
ncbi:hypothetical protein RB195_015795 [Necator americanus]|uniref:ETS domain-containing protein n=1 Tax=Necator americanus TaxID=51031 RepID=A0ABR1E678_NECAM